MTFISREVTACGNTYGMPYIMPAERGEGARTFASSTLLHTAISLVDSVHS